MKKVSVIVPVYQNEESLPSLCTELKKIEGELLQMELKLELMFVDDGSTDDSLNELFKIKKELESVKIIKLTRNFGAVSASSTGLQFVTGDCFLILAADLQDPPELILTMAKKWQEGSKYVVCFRIARNDPIMTKIFSFIYYVLLKLMVISDYPSGGFDMALMDRSILPYLQKSGKNINMSLFAYWLGFKPEIIHYERSQRTQGKSMWTFSKKVKYFIDSLLGFSILPIRMISLIGVFVSLMSIGYGSFIVIGALLAENKVRGFPTIVALFSFLIGLVIIMLGILGEYLWRIFDQVNQRPDSVIDEIY
ncbi:MAG: glycosyltransferase family 2 protein [Bacteroidetes bacterium]|nr:glycosyltransferase family 2 protein [Bacteroidota bacterium]